jgi:DNA ligase (NAD+)
VDTNTIIDPADLYFLTQEKLLSMNGWQKKKVLASKLLEAIRRTKTPPLDKFIFALGIRHVGEHIAEVLARYFMNLDTLTHATEEELFAIRDVGPEVARSITRFFGEPSNLNVIEKFREAGVTPIETAQTESADLAGKSFVFTGALNKLSRNEAKEIVESLGGKISESVTKKTDYLVTGETPGSKLQKAQSAGITILDEEGFLQLTIRK